MNVELFVARRYLRSRRRENFISIITIISVGGVTLGVAALILTLSMMNGFEKEVRSRIVGTTGGPVPVTKTQGLRDALSLPGGVISNIAGNLAEYARDSWQRWDEQCWSPSLLRATRSSSLPVPSSTTSWSDFGRSCVHRYRTVI